MIPIPVCISSGTMPSTYTAERKTGNTAVRAIHRVTFHAGSRMRSSHPSMAMPARLNRATYIGKAPAGVREGSGCMMGRAPPVIQSGVPCPCTC
jgi:hypothetical protein